jgi:hypothetical protein
MLRVSIRDFLLVMLAVYLGWGWLAELRRGSELSAEVAMANEKVTRANEQTSLEKAGRQRDTEHIQSYLRAYELELQWISDGNFDWPTVVPAADSTRWLSQSTGPETFELPRYYYGESPTSSPSRSSSRP